MKTFLFPTPKSASFTEASYHPNTALPTDELVAFCRAADTAPDIGFEHDAALGEEAYRLQIGSDGIRVAHNDDAGRFRALTTLYQLARDNGADLPCCDISDCPDFPRRGYMLDISRGRMPKVASIMRLIDTLALLKYNELQLYMESFCFKYSAYPAYTADIECLTPEDIHTLEAYCHERFIDLVPNQNSLGHMNTWLGQSAFRPLGIGDENTVTSTIDPLHPGTADFLDGLYGSLLPHFSSKYVNVGLDEPDGLGQYQTKAYCDEHGAGTLYRRHMDTVQSLVSGKYGKTMMYWADAVGWMNVPLDSLPKDAVALEWGYEILCAERMMMHCINYHEHGIPFYVCPACNIHCTYTGRTENTLCNIRATAEIGKKYGARGFLLTDWGDSGHPQFPVWSYVPIALGGEYAWNTGDPLNGWDFKAVKVNGACDFVDARYFGGNKVAKKLMLLGNYYLLETDRILNGTLTNRTLCRPLDTAAVPLSVCDDAYANDNIIRYLEHYLALIEAEPIDPLLKRQIAVNVSMVILGCEWGNMRISGADEAHKKQALERIDAIIAEYGELWDIDNYPRGKEILISQMKRNAAQLQ